MKQLLAIFLIAILIYNWCGYRIVTAILSKDADLRLESRLDNNEYDEAQLIEMKIPLNIPYQNNQTGFERHYGEIEIDGQYYTYVKRKIDNGFLILKCIPNKSKEQIKAAGNEYFKMANDLGQPDKKQDKSSFAKNFWTEYDGDENDYVLSNPAITINKHFLNNATLLYNVSLTAPAQPPEAVLS